MRLTRFPSAQQGRARWARRAGRGALRHGTRLAILAVLVLVVASGIGLAVILSGPTELGLLRGRVKEAIQAGLGPGYEVTVGSATLDVDPVLGLVVLVDGVAVDDPAGERAASIPSTRLAVDPLGIFTGGLVRSVELSGAKLAFTRNRYGRVALGSSSAADTAAAAPAETETPAASKAAGSEAAGGFPDLFAALQILDRGIEPSVAAALRNGFERFTMVDATIDIHDGTRDEARRFQRADLSLALQQSGAVDIELAATGYSGRWSATAERRIDPQTGDRILAGMFSQLTLADVFPGMAGDASPLSSDVPLFGRATVRLTSTGDVADAAIRLDLGAGNINFGNSRDSLLLDEATIKLRWDVADDVVRIEPSTLFFGESRAVVSGTVRPLGAASEGRYGFSLESQGAILAPRDSPAPPLAVERIALSGTADLPAKMMVIDNAIVLSPLGSVAAAGSIGFDGPSPSVAMAASFSPMPVTAAMQLWPPFIAGGARRWVLEHVSDGQVAAGRVEASIPAGLLWTGERVPIPEEALRVDFRLEDITFTTIGAVPPIRNAVGNAALAGSTFGIDIERGDITTASGKRVDVTAGIFAVPDTVPRQPDGQVELQLSGEAAALAELADAHPFKALSRRGIDRAGIKGSGTVDVSARWPMRPDLSEAEVDWKVSADLKDFGSDTPIEGRSISDATVDLTVTPQEVAINGTARIDGVQADISLLEPTGIGGTNNGQRQVRVLIDDAARKKLGIGLDEIMAGTVIATMSDLDDDRPGQHYELDLERARLTLSALGWSKGIGVPASLSFDLVTSEAGHRLDNLKLAGQGFGLSGSAVLDRSYGLVSADIGQFALRADDQISLDLKRHQGGYAITARGKSFDLRGLIAQLRQSVEKGQGSLDLSIDASITRLIGFHGEAIDGAKLSLEAASGSIRRFDLTGRLSGTELSASYADKTDTASLAVIAADSGRLFRFLDLYTRVGGGALRLVGQRNGKDAPMGGTFHIERFALVDEPAMGRVVSRTGARQGELTGFNPSRVLFDRMLLDFRTRGSVIVIDDALLRGAALGATFDGRIDLATSGIVFSGTYLPAYAVNNIFGQVPILGLALGGGSREGLVGVTFKIDGTLAAPRLTVNALSAIAPGIFRKIFEFR